MCPSGPNVTDGNLANVLLNPDFSSFTVVDANLDTVDDWSVAKNGTGSVKQKVEDPGDLPGDTQALRLEGISTVSPTTYSLIQTETENPALAPLFPANAALRCVFQYKVVSGVSPIGSRFSFGVISKDSGGSVLAAQFVTVTANVGWTRHIFFVKEAVAYKVEVSFGISFFLSQPILTWINHFSVVPVEEPWIGLRAVGRKAISV